MNDQQIVKKNDEIDGAIDKLFHNNLKDIDSTTIEQTIAKSLGELIGVEYKCCLEEIKYGNYRFKGGKLMINLSEKKEEV